MDIGIIIAIVGIGLTMIGVVISMMFWVRSEGNSVRNEAKSDRQDLIQLVYAIREETTKQINAIQLEMKDFHFKLLAIEERRNKTLVKE